MGMPADDVGPFLSDLSWLQLGLKARSHTAIVIVKAMSKKCVHIISMGLFKLRCRNHKKMTDIHFCNCECDIAIAVCE